MATATRTITGSILYEPGTAWEGADVVFTLVTGYATTATDTVLEQTYTATTDASGDFSITLAVPDSNAWQYHCRLPDGSGFRFNLEAGAATTLRAIIADANLTGTVSASALTALIDIHAADTTTHGTTGDIVGTSDTQTLTNKTINYNDNTITNLPSAVGAIDDLTDVTITTPADNEVLAYDNGTSEWINQTAAEASLAAATHAAAHTDGTDDIQDATAAQKGVATATQITKLDGVEALADKTDATNVNAAGATMNTDADISANTWVVDEDDLVSDLDTKVPTQQSVKAYADTMLPLAGGTMSGELDFSGTAHSGLAVISLTTVQRDAIGATNTGAIIWNTTESELQVYGGAAWAAIGGSGLTPPGASTDNAVVRWDGVGADTVDNSGVTIDDSGNVLAGAGSAATPALTTLSGAVKHGMYAVNATYLGLAAAGSLAAQIGSSYFIIKKEGLLIDVASGYLSIGNAANVKINTVGGTAGGTFLAGANDAIKIDADATSGNTRLLVYDVDNGTLDRVSVGAADSGGSGYKVLRIPN